jgi:DNA (cytosine-5)-methyltransferase 1
VPFLWVADFGKHFTDYCLAQSEVSLYHFRAHFLDWLRAQHSQSDIFDQWVAALHSSDFRTAVVAYLPWLWSESTDKQVDVDGQIRSHSLWTEIVHDAKNLTAITIQGNQLTTNAKNQKTIVTPLVYRNFSVMYFGGRLESRRIKDAYLKAACDKRKSELGFSREDHPTPSISSTPSFSKPPLGAIRKGDIVGVRRDEGTQWKSQASIWYREF